MTFDYLAKRITKHLQQAEAKAKKGPSIAGLIDLTPRTPNLAFIGMRTFKQSGQQRKGRSGYAEEHKQANIDNAAFIVKQLAENSTVVAELAEQGLAIDLNEVEKSIGGISENSGLPTDDTSRIG